MARMTSEQARNLLVGLCEYGADDEALLEAAQRLRGAYRDERLTKVVGGIVAPAEGTESDKVNVWTVGTLAVSDEDVDVEIEWSSTAGECMVDAIYCDECGGLCAPPKACDSHRGVWCSAECAKAWASRDLQELGLLTSVERQKIQDGVYTIEDYMSVWGRDYPRLDPAAVGLEEAAASAQKPEDQLASSSDPCTCPWRMLSLRGCPRMRGEPLCYTEDGA